MGMLKKEMIFSSCEGIVLKGGTLCKAGALNFGVLGTRNLNFGGGSTLNENMLLRVELSPGLGLSISEVAPP